MEDEAAQEDLEALEDIEDIDAGEDADEVLDEADKSAAPSGEIKSLDLILDIPLTVSVELGRSKMLINDLLQLGKG